VIDPTPRQVRALYHTQCFTEVHGRPPSYRELGRLIGLDPKNTWRHMHYAQKKGLHVDRVLTDAGRAAVVLLTGG
jgi:hypothetical protein